jgi:hypothetical protein
MAAYSVTYCTEFTKMFFALNHHKYHDTEVNITFFKPKEKYGLSYTDSEIIRQWSAALFADKLYRIPYKSENICRKYG